VRGYIACVTMWRVLSVGLCVVAGACAGGGAATLSPPPVPRDTGPLPYRVQIGDELAIRLFFTPELNEDVTVRPDGRITTSLAEAVPAAGRTPEDVAAALRSLYNKELRDPLMTVGVKTYAPMRVYVGGEVPAPGELTTGGPRLTLLQAVARAGGLRITGDADNVLIVRRGDNGVPVVYAAHYAEAVSGRDPGADVTLMPYDVVIVPKTGVARVFGYWNQYVQQFVPVSWGFSYNVNPLLNNPKTP
jgi:polysaccharide export outer membrane protein